MATKDKRNTSHIFRFKQFSIEQDRCAMKVGTDSILLGTWTDLTDIRQVLDIGSGTGVVSLILAQRAPQAKVTGVEIDLDAARQSRENVERSPWSDRIVIQEMSIQDFASNHTAQFDLIISNPPFFTGGTFSSNELKASVRHTVKLPHNDLLKSTRSLLHPLGKFCVVLPYIEGLRFIEIAQIGGFYCTRMTEVRPKANKPVERLLLCFELKEKTTAKSELIIMEADTNEYTTAFRELTKEFYL